MPWHNYKHVRFNCTFCVRSWTYFHFQRKALLFRGKKEGKRRKRICKQTSVSNLLGHILRTKERESWDRSCDLRKLSWDLWKRPNRQLPYSFILSLWMFIPSQRRFFNSQASTSLRDINSVIAALESAYWFSTADTKSLGLLPPLLCNFNCFNCSGQLSRIIFLDIDISICIIFIIMDQRLSF